MGKTKQSNALPAMSMWSLNRSNFIPFDIDREIESTERIDAVNKLLGNDLYTQSYPGNFEIIAYLVHFHS